MKEMKTKTILPPANRAFLFVILSPVPFKKRKTKAKFDAVKYDPSILSRLDSGDSNKSNKALKRKQHMIIEYTHIINLTERGIPLFFLVQRPRHSLATKRDRFCPSALARRKPSSEFHQPRFSAPIYPSSGPNSAIPPQPLRASAEEPESNQLR